VRVEASYPDLAGKAALVTGGADGIGRAIVEALARQGSKVAFLDIDAERGKRLTVELTAAGGTVSFHHVDLRDIPTTQAAIAAARALHGPFAIGVNNAGHDERHDFEGVTEAYWDDRLAVNLRPMMFVAQALAPDMRGLGGGALVNLSSTSWMKGSPHMIAYTTAKSAVIGFTRSLARALGPDGIRVNCVTPGWVMTERQRSQWWTPEKGAANQAAQALKGDILPEDIAQMVLFLCSDVSRMCAGQNFIVDAGTV
jgi:NAD(P)-dependent dehydrogenase (short-subunit alcohol dehydrogenase family)